MYDMKKHKTTRVSLRIVSVTNYTDSKSHVYYYYYHYIYLFILDNPKSQLKIIWKQLDFKHKLKQLKQTIHHQSKDNNLQTAKR